MLDIHHLFWDFLSLVRALQSIAMLESFFLIPWMENEYLPKHKKTVKCMCTGIDQSRNLVWQPDSRDAKTTVDSNLA